MYNLNINMTTSASSAVNNLLSVENSCTTPRTPEILNSLIAMTNPLDNYNFGDDAPKRFHHPNHTSSDSNSSSCSQESRTTTAATTLPTNGPTSVQQTCSQLIKAGLKLTIEQKRKLQNDSDDLLDLDKIKKIKRNESESEEDKSHNINGLTPEDEERRRRRRERNKIAATKCRLKKRERTANLVNESETLETQNIDLKSQVQELQNQCRHLTEVLSLHKATCAKNIRSTSDHLYNRLPPVHSVIEPNHSYNTRPTSVDTYRPPQPTPDSYRPTNAVVTGTDTSYLLYTTRNSMVNYNNANAKAPNIIVEPVNDDDNYQTSLTDLDNQTETYSYNNQQCHNYQTQPNYGNHGIDGCMA